MGGRGRGGFRGGRGGAAANPFAGDMGTLTHQDIKEVMGSHKNEKYPVRSFSLKPDSRTDSTEVLERKQEARLTEMTEREAQVLKWTKSTDDIMRYNTDWRLTVPGKKHIDIGSLLPYMVQALNGRNRVILGQVQAKVCTRYSRKQRTSRPPTPSHVSRTLSSRSLEDVLRESPAVCQELVVLFTIRS